MTRTRVPDGLDPEVFGDDLLAVMKQEAMSLASAGKDGKSLQFDRMAPRDWYSARKSRASCCIRKVGMRPDWGIL
jgi:hypothetical protein